MTIKVNTYETNQSRIRKLHSWNLRDVRDTPTYSLSLLAQLGRLPAKAILVDLTLSEKDFISLIICVLYSYI